MVVDEGEDVRQAECGGGREQYQFGFLECSPKRQDDGLQIRRWLQRWSVYPLRHRHQAKVSA